MTGRSKKLLTVVGYPVCVLIGVAITMGLIPVYRIVSSITFGRHIQTVMSANETHSAVLLRKHNLADFNFIVEVDGLRVYTSPDLCGGADHEYRETLVWDKSGQTVVLELMGKRVFAYNANDKVSLGRGQLEEYEFHPMPNDLDCAYLKDIDE